MRGKVSRWFNGQMQYTLSRGDNDTNGIGSFPANDYDLSGEWARADFDRRHRFNLLGRDDRGQAVRPRRRAVDEHRRALQRDARPRSLQQRPRPGAAGRRAAQQPRGRPASRRSTSGRRATSSSARGKDAREITLGFDAFNVLEPRELRLVRRHAELAAVRPAGLGAGGAPAAVLGAHEILTGHRGNAKRSSICDTHWRWRRFCCLAAIGGLQGQDGPYHAGPVIQIGGEGGWDYLSVDSRGASPLRQPRDPRRRRSTRRPTRSSATSPTRPACTASRSPSPTSARASRATAARTTSSIVDLKTLKLHSEDRHRREPRRDPLRAGEERGLHDERPRQVGDRDRRRERQGRRDRFRSKASPKRRRPTPRPARSTSTWKI